MMQVQITIEVDTRDGEWTVNLDGRDDVSGRFDEFGMPVIETGYVSDEELIYRLVEFAQAV